MLVIGGSKKDDKGREQQCNAVEILDLKSYKWKKIISEIDVKLYNTQYHNDFTGSSRYWARGNLIGKKIFFCRREEYDYDPEPNDWRYETHYSVDFYAFDIKKQKFGSINLKRSK